MVDEQAEDESPAAIRKHVEQVREKWDVPVVYVRDRIIAYFSNTTVAGIAAMITQS